MLLPRSALGGTVLFQDALAQRLGIMRPSQQQLHAFLAAHPPRISQGESLCNQCICRPRREACHDQSWPAMTLLEGQNADVGWGAKDLTLTDDACTGIPELVSMLQQRGTGVFLVSGGFRAIINPIADMLRIPQDHVYANTILFMVWVGKACTNQALLLALLE